MPNLKVQNELQAVAQSETLDFFFNPFGWPRRADHLMSDPGVNVDDEQAQRTGEEETALTLC